MAKADQSPLSDNTVVATPSVCPHCGQSTPPFEVDGGSDSTSPFMFDPLGDKPRPDEGHREQSIAIRRPKPGPATVVAFLLAIGGFGYALSSVIGSDGDGAADANDSAEAVFDGEDNELFDSDSDSGDDGEGDGLSTADVGSAGGTAESADRGDPDFPPSDEHMEAEEIAGLFEERLGGDVTYGVAYVSDDGLRTVGPWGDGEPSIQTAHTLDRALGNPLISDGTRTWAIDRADPQSAYIVSGNLEVVVTELSGKLAFVGKEEDRVELGVSVFGGRRPGVAIPRLSEVLAVPGRGLLVAPATGGTYVAAADGTLSRISEDRIVSAGVESEVYQRCDETLQCEVYAISPGSEGGQQRRVLEFEADTSVTMSPNGTHVVGPAEGEGQLTVIATESGETVDLGPQNVLATGWAPDSSFVAVAVPGRLLFVTVDDGEVLSVPLPADPRSSSLLVFPVQRGVTG